MTEKLNYLNELSIKNQNSVYTESEIITLLDESTLDEETKHHIGGFINGVMQCIYNVIATDNFEHTERALLINNPDQWSEGYNSIIKIFQLYHYCAQQR
jgi:hypothetical protein